MSEQVTYGIIQATNDNEINVIAGTLQLMDMLLEDDFEARLRVAEYILSREKDNDPI